MFHIQKSVSRCSDDVLKRFAQEDTASVHEAMGRRGAMEPEIKPIAKGMKCCGRAVTVQCHSGDNLMLNKAIQMARPNDVIVADMGRILSAGPFGEVMATECMTKRVAGLIVTGSVRDSSQIIEMGFPVFSKSLSICGTVKATLGTINHPISCGGEIVRPGDIILADDDGVVVIPPEQAEEILAAVHARHEKEAHVMERIRAGESLFDIYGYQAVLDRLGCTYEE